MLCVRPVDSRDDQNRQTEKAGSEVYAPAGLFQRHCTTSVSGIVRETPEVVATTIRVTDGLRTNRTYALTGKLHTGIVLSPKATQS
jgi:hypothetical protein